MMRIYGQSRWCKEFGKTDDGTWLTGLQGLSNPAVSRGLHACIHSANTFPPNVGEFRALCLDAPKKIDVVFKALSGRFEKGSLAHTLWLTVTSWDWANKTENELRKRLESNFDSAYENYELKTLNIEYSSMLLQLEAS